VICRRSQNSKVKTYYFLFIITHMPHLTLYDPYDPI
jgi:hypothetical protein